MDSQAAKYFFNRHFEWMALSAGMLIMGLMNPYAAHGPSWCPIERMGFSFCPGDGLGHSIAFIFRGDFQQAFQANILGPLAFVVLSARVLYLIKNRVINSDDEPITIK